MKDIIYVWTIKPGPFNFPETNPKICGGLVISLGMITTLKTYEHSEHELTIDIFNHPIAKYLQLEDHKYKNYVKENIKKYSGVVII